MIAVIFEVTPHKAHHDEYLAIAGELLPILQGMDGFIPVVLVQAIQINAKGRAEKHLPVPVPIAPSNSIDTYQTL